MKNTKAFNEPRQFTICLCNLPIVNGNLMENTETYNGDCEIMTNQKNANALSENSDNKLSLSRLWIFNW